jgi:hypothetical protein
LARWRRTTRLEFPAWVRVFVADEWRDDAADWRVPAHCRDWHAKARWVRARCDWLRSHPEASKQEAEDLLAALEAPRG